MLATIYPASFWKYTANPSYKALFFFFYGAQHSGYSLGMGWHGTFLTSTTPCGAGLYDSATALQVRRACDPEQWMRWPSAGLWALRLRKRKERNI